MPDADAVSVELEPAPSYWLFRVKIPYTEHGSGKAGMRTHVMLRAGLEQMHRAIGEALERGKADPAAAYAQKHG